MRTIITAVLAFVSGIAVHAIVGHLYPADPLGDLAVSRHWSVVREFNRQLRDPRNYMKDAPTGRWKTDVPVDPDFSLATLVAAGELEYVDLVLPDVPKNEQTNQYWMQFVDARPDKIVYATGNPEYVAYKVSGDPPLHLQLWFRSDATSDVHTLVTELEKLADTRP
jgi:hypothetical protein